MQLKLLNKFVGESGSALVAALAGTFVLSLIAVAVLALSTTQMAITAHDRQSLIAFNVADAGVTRAIYQLNRSDSYTGETGVAGNGEYSVAVSTPLDDPKARIITATGFYPNIANYKIRRKIMTRAELRLSHAFDYALIGSHGLKLKGTVDITGNIHSNSNIEAEGKVYVDGMATAVGSIDADHEVTFTQGQQSGAASVVFPAIDAAGLKEQAKANGETWGDVKIDGKTVATVQGLIHGNLEIKNQAQVTFSGVVYVEGKIEIKNSATVTGNNIVVADEEIEIENNTVITSSAGGTLTFISLESGEEAIEVKNNANISAILYAPEGEIELENQAYVFGSVVAKTIEAENNVTIIHGEALSPPPSLPGSFVIKSWREVAP